MHFSITLTKDFQFLRMKQDLSVCVSMNRHLLRDYISHTVKAWQIILLLPDNYKDACPQEWGVSSIPLAVEAQPRGVTTEDYSSEQVQGQRSGPPDHSS